MNISKSSADLHENNKSLKEALAIMRGLGGKKNDGALTLHSIAKELYQYTLSYAKKSECDKFDLDEIDDMMETPEATREIMLATKENLRMILAGTSSKKIGNHEGKDTSSQETIQSSLISQIKERDNKIKSLEALMVESQKNSKTIQLKLLNSIKKMNVQLQEKELQMNELKQIVAEKEEQMESLAKVNDKKYKRIRELEEDLYDLQVELENKNSELMAEKNCSVILQKKLNKIIDQSILSGHGNEETNLSSTIQEFNLASQLSKPENILTMNSQMGIQTENQVNTKQQQLSLMSESRESQYLESIERLTTELSEAYQRINELTGNEANKDSQGRRLGKTKTSSTYFSKKR